MNNKRYYIWCSKKTKLWITIEYIKANEGIWVKDGTTQKYTMNVEAMLDNIILVNVKNKKRRKYSYYYDILWSDCGNIRSNSVYVHPYGLSDNYKDDEFIMRKNVGLRRLEDDISQLLTINYESIRLS